MTTPAAPAPAAGAPADAGTPAPAGQQTATPPADSGTTPPPATGTGDQTPAPSSTPPAGQPPADGAAAGATGQDGKPFTAEYVKSLRDEAKGHRTAKEAAEKKATDLAAALDSVRKLLDPNAAAEADPAKVAEQAIKERDEQAAKLRALEAERVAEKAARKAGADVDALLDSRGFANGLAKLDPSAATFDADVTALVTTALEANPRLKATPPAPAQSVTDNGASQPTNGPQSIDDIRAERRKRRTG